jgi:hypothetical protein
MHTILIRLDPRLLSNPDLDIRYVLPDLLAERSGGVITDDGYDYVGDRPFMILFLKVADLDSAIETILDLIENIRVLGNDLRQGSVVAIRRDGHDEVVYPIGYTEPILP